MARKITLVLLLILITFQVAWADENFITDAKGCKVFNPVPHEKESVTWSSICKDGYASGNGVLQWYTDGVLGDRYEGSLVDGKAIGKGKYTDKNGNVYEGDFVNSQMSGTGKLTLLDGTKYEGDFANNKINGMGKLTLPNGVVYEGYFEDGKFVGSKNNPKSSALIKT